MIFGHRPFVLVEVADVLLGPHEALEVGHDRGRLVALGSRGEAERQGHKAGERLHASRVACRQVPNEPRPLASARRRSGRPVGRGAAAGGGQQHAPAQQPKAIA